MEFSQFTVFANNLAVEVFHVHLGPQNKYAHTVFLFSIAFCNVSFTNDCHTRFVKSDGLYLR
ncbi:hypothetical protein HOA93_03990 [bacterium]|nr:hypothetical protein [bacterium]